MTEVKTRSDAPSSMAERIAKREGNSGDPSADVVTKRGEGARRTFHNLHYSGSAGKHGEVNRGEGDINNDPRTKV